MLSVDRAVRDYRRSPIAEKQRRKKDLFDGLKEAETLADRKSNGIPLHAEVLSWFDTACQKLGVENALQNRF